MRIQFLSFTNSLKVRKFKNLQLTSLEGVYEIYRFPLSNYQKLTVRLGKEWLTNEKSFRGIMSYETLFWVHFPKKEVSSRNKVIFRLLYVILPFSVICICSERNKELSLRFMTGHLHKKDEKINQTKINSPSPGRHRSVSRLYLAELFGRCMSYSPGGRRRRTRPPFVP